MMDSGSGSDGVGLYFGLDRRSLTRVLSDFGDDGYPNAHAVLLAASSFYSQLYVLRAVNAGIPCYVIHTEGRYPALTAVPGGRSFAPGLPGQGLNPFVVRYESRGVLDDHIGRLAGLLAAGFGDEAGEAEDRLRWTLERRLREWYEAEPPGVDGGAPVLGRGGLPAFAAAIDAGLDPGLLGRPQRVRGGWAWNVVGAVGPGLMGDEEPPVTVFDLRELPAGLQPWGVRACVDSVWARAVSRPRPRMLVIDDCRVAMADAGCAQALVGLVKRGRPYRLGLLGVARDAATLESSVDGAAWPDLFDHVAFRLALGEPAAGWRRAFSFLDWDAALAWGYVADDREKGILWSRKGLASLDLQVSPAERAALASALD